MKEADVEQIYEKVKDLEEKKDQDTIDRIPTDVRPWITALIVGIVVATALDYITLQTGVILGIMLLLSMRFMFGQSLIQRELSEQELANALYYKLRYKQVNPLGNYYQINPRTEIRIEKVGRRVRINGVPQERVFGVSLYYPKTRLKEWFKYTLDLKTADITGVKKLPAGFVELDDWDIKIIESRGIKDEKLYNTALGVKPKRI